MTTQKQIKANQRNAQKSTGPITDVRSITTSVSSFLLHSRFARPARPLRVCAGQTPRHLLCRMHAQCRDGNLSYTRLGASCGVAVPDWRSDLMKTPPCMCPSCRKPLPIRDGLSK